MGTTRTRLNSLAWQGGKTRFALTRAVSTRAAYRAALADSTRPFTRNLTPPVRALQENLGGCGHFLSGLSQKLARHAGCLSAHGGLRCGLMLTALVTAIALQLHRGPVPADVASAIASACAHEAAIGPADPAVCVSLVTTYMAHESGYSDAPAPQSWDGRSGVSCSYLQLPCRWGKHSAEWQARAWLALLRRGTLAGLSGYGRGGARIAAQRLHEATEALSAARAQIAAAPAPAQPTASGPVATPRPASAACAIPATARPAL